MGYGGPTSVTSVAVVIPLFNKAKYIERALLSVLSQSLPPNEVIVVDDGSTDGGGKLATRVGGSHVRVVTQPNAGESAARNRGIHLAQGDWVAFLDADDEWHPDFLLRCVEAKSEFPDVVGVFVNYRRDDSGDAVLQRESSEPVRIQNYFAFALRNRGRGMTSSSVMIRRDVLLKVGGFPETVARGEDLDTWARVAWAGPVAFVPDVLAVYYRTPGSVTRSAGTLTPPVNPWLRKTWPPDGEIPHSIQKDSETVFRLRNRLYARRLLEAGRKREAMGTLLARCAPFPYPADYARLWLVCLAPRQLVATVRHARGKCVGRVAAAKEDGG